MAGCDSYACGSLSLWDMGFPRRAGSGVYKKPLISVWNVWELDDLTESGKFPCGGCKYPSD